mgnify:CR=1 FL=1
MEATIEVAAVAPAGTAGLPEPRAAGTTAPSRMLAPPGEYLSFRLGDESYGIDILRVKEIRSYEAPTRIAGASPFVKGVVNLRGVIVPIVDLRLLLGCERAEVDGFTVVIVLVVGGREVGVVVDAVADVQELEAAHIKPAPALGERVDSSYISGIGAVGEGKGEGKPESDRERMLILVDVERMLAHAGLERISP